MKTGLLVVALVAGFAAQGAEAREGRGLQIDFATVDTDQSGTISLAEMEAAGAARFAAADTDGDGGLSAEEIAAQRQADMVDRATRMISRLDTNEDGLLQAEELERPRRSLERMFERADTDGDGEISQDEFDAAQERRGGGHGHRDRG